ncbi:MAG: hypothetical protein RTU92_03450 [Candidatus Thorarchaeota archaeon]
MSSLEDLLKKAKKAADEGDREKATRQLEKLAEKLAAVERYRESSRIYQEIGLIYRDMYLADDCFKSFENATLMLVRMPSDPEVYQEIVNLNKNAGKIAENATEYKKAADFYFRASDFAEIEEEKKDLTIKAADALENLADIVEEENDIPGAVKLLKKVGRLYYSAGDDELASRIYDRARRLSFRYAETTKNQGDLVASGNALAEVAQIMQIAGDSPEATRLMIDAGELYEAAGFFEKAGNIFDAAHEAYKLLRVTAATRGAMMKAAEAYMKMKGKPEILAPLIVKAGRMYQEIGRVMKAKWAFKHGSELFEELAKKSAKDGDIESEKKYLRFQAMCLRNWGNSEQADAIYDSVVSFYEQQANTYMEEDDKELQAVALEEAADVLHEYGKVNEALSQLEKALNLYVELAEESSSTDQSENASKYYSKAAECAKSLGDDAKYIEYHRISSEMASKVAKFYFDLEVVELSTIWTRTAGLEAIATGNKGLINEAVEMLSSSAVGFMNIKEYKEAFEDYYTVFITQFEFFPKRKKVLRKLLKEMDRISVITQDDVMIAVLAVLRPMESDSYTAALLTLQAREEELLDRRDKLHELITDRMPKTGTGVSTRYGIR